MRPSFFDKSIVNNEELAKLLCRHMTPLGVQYRVNDIEAAAVFSAFLVKIKQYAFVITAGHIKEDLQELISNPSYTDVCFSLLDGNVLSNGDRHLLPLNEDILLNMRFIDHSGYDYAYMPLPQLYYDPLVANGAVPLDETYWQEESPDIDDLFIVGAPQSWNVTSNPSRKIEFYYCLHPFKKLSEKPERMDPRPEGAIFGELINPSTNINGMSGGPIFGLKRGPDRLLKRYYLLGVQSSWLEPLYIAASPIPLLIEIIYKLIQEEQQLKV